MTAKNQNFEMYAGDSQVLVVPLNFDLTGAKEIKWTLKISAGSTEKLIYKEFSSNNGIEITNSGPVPEDENIFQIQLNPEDTLNLKGTYYHEAEVTDNQGNVSTVMVGFPKIIISGV